MGFLSNIGGMLPAAYAGFQKGVDDVTARQQREADAAYQKEKRDREREMAPLEDEIRKKRLAAAGIKIDNEMELAPGQQELSLGQQRLGRQELEHRQKTSPLMYEAEAWDVLRKASGSKEAFVSAAAAKLGESIHNNDLVGINVGVKNMFDAGLLNDVDGLKGVSAVRSEMVQAPDGAVDFRGQPVAGKVIQTTLSDGRKGYIGTNHMLAQYAKQLQAADAAGAKIIKPGEEWRTPSGRLLAEGKEKVYPGGVVEDANGDFVRIPGVGGTGAGSRSGAGGKAPASPQSAAVGFFATAAEKAETKLAPTQIAYGQRLAEQIATQRNESGQPIPPAIAAEVAMEVALDPAKIQPQVNVQTGKIEGVFSRRDLGDIVVEPWSPALQRSFTPEQLTKAAEELVKAQPEAVRAEFSAAAHDPAARKALLDKVTQEIAAKVPPDQVQAYTQSTLASLTEKLDIVAKNTKPPKAAASTSIRSRLGFGGMTPPPAYKAPEDSAAGKAQARQAEARAKAAEAEQQRNAARDELSKQFNADAKSMDPLDLARKYDALRGQLPTKDAAALQQIERTIR